MGKNTANLRFGIKRSDGYVSNIWRMWATKHGDVYLTTKGVGGSDHKYSFHQSGICRSAFTKEHGIPKKMNDRAMFKWRRAKTPDKGVMSCSRLLLLGIPTDYLSKDNKKETKKVKWIESAPEKSSTFIEISLTKESENNIKLIPDFNREILLFSPLSTGENLLVMYSHEEWKNKNITSPPSKDPEAIFKELYFSDTDPNNTGRPIRMIWGPKPRDGESLILQEIGGYQIHA